MRKPYCPRFQNEDELQDWLEDEFEKAGWTAIREVTPHSSSVRADLIVNHEGYGWIGIETKHCNTASEGGTIAEGFRQITQQYRGKRYLGNKIDLWVIAPYFDHDHRESRHYPIRKFTRPFFNYFGIGYMSLSDKRLVMDFGFNDRRLKITVADISPYDNNWCCDADLDMITNRVSSRLQKV